MDKPATMDKQQLWRSLRTYHFDNLVPPHLWSRIQEAFGGENASTQAFADKISRKLGWTNGYALQAIAEYKKFVYLAVVSDFNVTPSKIIDQVWHEHLLFNKAYREFCSEVINYTLDHNPELVQTGEGVAIFNKQYFDTIDLYKREFGTDPPAHIWNLTKFAGKSLRTDEDESKKKKNPGGGFAGSSADDIPLFLLFASPDQQGASGDFPEFGGFGDGSTGGAGADGNWDSGSNDSGSCSANSCSSSCGGGD